MTLSSSTKLRLLAIFTVLLVTTFVWPFETTVVPEWKLRVVDQTGQRLRGNRVRESWQHYTF